MERLASIARHSFGERCAAVLTRTPRLFHYPERHPHGRDPPNRPPTRPPQPLPNQSQRPEASRGRLGIGCGGRAGGRLGGRFGRFGSAGYAKSLCICIRLPLSPGKAPQTVYTYTWPAGRLLRSAQAWPAGRLLRPPGRRVAPRRWNQIA